MQIAPKKNALTSKPIRSLKSKDRAPALEDVKVKPPRKARHLAQPPDLGPQYELPVTRHGGKRKANDVGLQAIGGSSSKKAKKNVTSTSRDKASSKQKKKAGV